MFEARTAFRVATLSSDFDAAVAAELAWNASKCELRPVLARVRHPKRQPFTAEDVDAAVAGIRRWADRVFNRALKDELEDDWGEPEDENE